MTATVEELLDSVAQAREHLSIGKADGAIWHSVSCLCKYCLQADCWFIGASAARPLKCDRLFAR